MSTPIIACPASWYATRALRAPETERLPLAPTTILWYTSSIISGVIIPDFSSRTARIAHSFITFARSAPENPVVCFARSRRLASGLKSLSLACTLSISSRP